MAYCCCRCCDNLTRGQPRSWRLPMTLRPQISTEKCYIDEENMFNLVFHFNPQVHGGLTLEFLSQVIEKYKTETVAPARELYSFCDGMYRTDFRFEVIEMTVRGQKYTREFLENFFIGLTLMPGEKIILETFTSIVTSPLCCCTKSCNCTVF